MDRNKKEALPNFSMRKPFSRQAEATPNTNVSAPVERSIVETAALGIKPDREEDSVRYVKSVEHAERIFEYNPSDAAKFGHDLRSLFREGHRALGVISALIGLFWLFTGVVAKGIYAGVRELRQGKILDGIKTALFTPIKTFVNFRDGWRHGNTYFNRMGEAWAAVEKEKTQ